MQGKAVEGLRNAVKQGGARAQDIYQTNVQPAVKGAYGATKGAAKNLYNRTPEDIRNAIENLRKQTASGTRDAFNSIKSGIDNSRFYKGSPLERWDKYDPLGGLANINYSGYGGF